MFVRRSRYDALRKEYQGLLGNNVSLSQCCRDLEQRLTKVTASHAELTSKANKLEGENQSLRWKLMRVHAAMTDPALDVEDRQSVEEFEEETNETAT